MRGRPPDPGMVHPAAPPRPDSSLYRITGYRTWELRSFNYLPSRESHLGHHRFPLHRRNATMLRPTHIFRGDCRYSSSPRRNFRSRSRRWRSISSMRRSSSRRPRWVNSSNSQGNTRRGDRRRHARHGFAIADDLDGEFLPRLGCSHLCLVVIRYGSLIADFSRSLGLRL